MVWRYVTNVIKRFIKNKFTLPGTRKVVMKVTAFFYFISYIICMKDKQLRDTLKSIGMWRLEDNASKE